jgi:hypothetical protein
MIHDVWGSGATRLNEITFVGHLGMTTSLRAERLRDKDSSLPIANGEVEERQVDSDTGQPHAAFGRMPQRSGLSVPTSNVGDRKGVRLERRRDASRSRRRRPG